ncbi:HAMP domain-containing histidine kinase [Rhizobium grahamii]|uniref:histidine kinase n=1 Tax=Rhizobium grahamii TaxID=1120045 RepID=A0A5Q0C9F5_9HYPH|nr:MULTISPECIES: HAMP domain-containing sensor histidine kinase [Rhizobium]QFY62082.1 HAMP domain-containing histidine kinase [Rhizobium grahamii]QRM48738.1 HAMP domain-containing histidine kinase [Rhizobium sp. BG6]
MMGSLRFRLAVGALVAIGVALTIVWFVLSHLFTDYLADQYSYEMTGVMDSLAARLTVEDGRLVLTGELADTRFDLPTGGRYWQISPSDGGRPLRSRSLWDEEIAAGDLSADLYCGFRQTDGPDGLPVLVSEKRMSLGEGAARKEFTIYTGFSKAEMETVLESYHRPLRLMLLSIGGILLLAAFLQGWIGLRPLARLRDSVADIRAGRLAHIGWSGPREVTPLVREINLLLTERETAVERARARASDLAHGLKTPLTVLSHLAESLPAEKRDTALQQIELVRQRSDRQLQAARMGVEQMATTSLLGISGKLVNVLQAFTSGKGIDWHVDIDPALSIQADPADIAEALGNVLDNAVRFARSRIELSARHDQRHIVLIVSDDGPGAGAESYDRMLKRGVTINDETSGSGLGLAISADIVEAYGGKLDLLASKLGGLMVKMTLPASEVAP